MWLLLPVALLLTGPSAGIIAAAGSQPSLIPWPTDATFPAGSPVVLSAATSRIRYMSPELAGAAEVLASDLVEVHGLELQTESGGLPAPGDVILSLASSPRGPPPPPPPPPSPPSPPPHPVTCPEPSVGVQLNNTLYADTSGPRESTGPSDCCAKCAATSGCAHWSYQVDPAYPGPYPA
jgi:hypothetical protein